MAKKEDVVPEEATVIDINELKKQLKTPDGVYAGVCALKGWKNGKKVTKAEYQQAITDFMAGMNKAIGAGEVKKC